MSASSPSASATKRMSPRERVLAAVNHTPPDRVPFAWGFCCTPEMGRILEAYFAAEGVDWARLRAAVGDIIPVGPPATGPALPKGTDLWGIRRATREYGGGSYEEIEHYPLAAMDDPKQLDDYPWPDPDAYDYAACLEGRNRTDPDGRLATRIAGGNPFEIYCWMRGLEQAMIDLLVERDFLRAAMERIVSFFEAKLVRSLAVCADEVDLAFFADDLGSQTGPLVSREVYRQMLQPFHRRLFAALKARAPRAKVMFHSDGAVFDLLPDLMEAGVEIHEAVQTDAAGMAPERLKAAYGGRLAFHGGLSVQQLLPRASAAEVEAECRRLVEVFGAGGGYIAAPSHAIQVGTPPENIPAMLRGVLGPEEYERALAAARKEG